MESILHKIRFSFDLMGPAEKKIANYLLDHTGEIISLSISEFAAHCDCGNATVVRFSRRLGLEGYQELKLRIAAELNAASSIGGEISREDGCYEIFQKRINDIYDSLKNTETVLDPDALNKMIVASRIASLRDTGIFQVLPMSAINFGKVAIVGFGGEAFTHYGTSVRQACPEMKYMLTTCCTNGGEGYLPTASAFAEGGYEVIRTIFSPTLEEECTKMAKKLVEETQV